jgi:hypothetical protein
VAWVLARSGPGRARAEAVGVGGAAVRLLLGRAGRGKRGVGGHGAGGATARLVRHEQATAGGYGASRRGWSGPCGRRVERAGVARAGAGAAARRRPEQKRAVLGRRACRCRTWRPELAACRTGEHRGVDRTREDLEVTDAEPVKWERVKDVRGKAEASAGPADEEEEE